MSEEFIKQVIETLKKMMYYADNGLIGDEIPNYLHFDEDYEKAQEILAGLEDLIK